MQPAVRQLGLIAVVLTLVLMTASPVRTETSRSQAAGRQRPAAQSRPDTPELRPGTATDAADDLTGSNQQPVTAMPSHESGERLFQEETFGGNGRTCMSCHVPADGFSITPQRVRDLFRDDRTQPLFQLRDSDAGDGDRWTIVRRHGLFSLEVRLHERIELEGDPAARSILVRRAVPSLHNVHLTGPYGGDGSQESVVDAVQRCAREQLGAARGAVSRRDASSLQLYQEQLLMPARLLGWSPPETVPQAPASTLPVLSEATVRGQQLFNTYCARCHGGELMHQEPGGPRPLFADVGISAANEHQLPVYRLIFSADDGSSTAVETPDPGRAAATGRLDDLNRFSVPSLRGVLHTAPYFHDHSAADLAEVIAHYEERMNLQLAGTEVDELLAYLESL